MTPPPELRADVARSLYESWVQEDFTNEYCSWEQLQGKDVWLDRADAAIAVFLAWVEQEWVRVERID